MSSSDQETGTGGARAPGALKFVRVTDAHAKRYEQWLASMTKKELLEYADRKMMPREYMLQSWRRARKAQRRTT